MKKKERKPNKVVTTLKYRLKDSSCAEKLNKMASKANFVWNFCNETSFNAIRNYADFLSSFDLHKLTSGTSKELGLSSTTVQSICEEYATRRIQFKKRKLRWRTSKGSRRSLGWIPFKASAIKILGDSVRYRNHNFRFWNSRPISGKILSGSFSQDSMGKWYVNIACESDKIETEHPEDAIGIDLGLKTSAVLSNGKEISNNMEFRALEEKLGKAQRENKNNLAKKIHAKIKNRRIDYLHKETTKIAKKFKTIFVGNVKGKFLQATNGKSLTDASIGIIRNILKYKAIRHSGNFFEVNEKFSTVTCSTCHKKTGPSGLSDLGVREWTCGECFDRHDRDINAAKNILRFGHESLRGAYAL